MPIRHTHIETGSQRLRPAPRSPCPLMSCRLRRRSPRRSATAFSRRNRHTSQRRRLCVSDWCCASILDMNRTALRKAALELCATDRGLACNSAVAASARLFKRRRSPPRRRRPSGGKPIRRFDPHCAGRKFSYPHTPSNSQFHHLHKILSITTTALPVRNQQIF